MKNKIQEWEKDPFVIALRENDTWTVERLLKSGRTVRDHFRVNVTPLHIAAEAGATDCVTQLLAMGAEIEALDDLGQTPLIHAIGAGQVETAGCLLDAGACIQYTHTPVETPEKREEARKMLEQSMEMARESHPEMFDLINDPDMGMAQDELSREINGMVTDAMFATREVHAVNICLDLDILCLLVEGKGADVNVHEYGGFWPLYNFAHLGDIEAVEWLLKHGAKPDFTFTGETALHTAVAGNHIECARLLLQAGADPNQQDVDGCVPMWRVSSKPMLELLISAGADVNITDQAGFKPSHWVEDPDIKSHLRTLEKKRRKTEDERLKTKD